MASIQLMTRITNVLQRSRSWLSRALRLLTSKSVQACWVGGRNWGDQLTPFLISQLAGRTTVPPVTRWLTTYTMVGSVLGSSSARAHVWGAGFISADAKPDGRPKKIHAVRGPLSREIFIRHGMECPPVYGDPAILLSTILPRENSKEYRFGIIPHYVDKGHPWISEQLASFGAETKIIDIESGISDVVDQINQCEFIISSSLHGLICADTYSIPNTRISLSTDVLGGDFKFRDYRLGVGGIEYVNHWPVEEGLDLPRLAAASTLIDVTQPAKRLLSVFPIALRDEGKVTFREG